ncbi:MAG: DNA adenine methylase [Sulfuritalea sp.]|nr:DNA adenine methylase [Sulfuritalea sp.]
MSIPCFFSPLRYPGGKGKLAEFIKAVIRENRLADGDYVEVYAGGAAVAMELLLHDYVSRIHINDLNSSIYSFWHSVLNEADALCDLIEQTAVNMDSWHQQKAVQSEAGKCSLLDLGFSTFFLNRCNRSGIIKGGVIGGKGQAGNWKLDARYNKPDLIRRIEQIARHRRRITLHNLDAADLITKVLPELPAKSLIYLDPPYYVKGEGLYDSFYSHDDHLQIAKLVTNTIKKQKWLVSYDKTPEIQAMYSTYRSMEYRLSYSAQERVKGSELIFFSDSLFIPQVPESCPMHAA